MTLACYVGGRGCGILRTVQEDALLACCNSSESSAAWISVRNRRLQQWGYAPQSNPGHGWSTTTTLPRHTVPTPPTPPHYTTPPCLSHTTLSITTTTTTLPRHTTPHCSNTTTLHHATPRNTTPHTTLIQHCHTISSTPPQQTWKRVERVQAELGVCARACVCVLRVYAMSVVSDKPIPPWLESVITALVSAEVFHPAARPNNCTFPLRSGPSSNCPSPLFHL